MPHSDSAIISEVDNYIASAHNDDFALFDVELVNLLVIVY